MEKCKMKLGKQLNKARKIFNVRCVGIYTLKIERTIS